MVLKQAPLKLARMASLSLSGTNSRWLKPWTLAATLLATAWALNVEAAGSVSLLDNQQTGSFCDITWDVPFAQGFTMPNNGTSYQLSSVTLYTLVTLWNAGTPPAEVSLWSNTGGRPGTELGIIGSQPVVQNGANLTINSAPGLILSPGQSYFIQFEAPNGMWVLSCSSPQVSSGVASFGQFLEQDSYAIDFTASMGLSAIVVPEPSVLGLGLAALVFTAARRSCAGR